MKNDIYENNKIRIFISHRDSMKKEAGEIAKSLEAYGCSCFVAHDSIAPMKEWKNEIYSALQDMDAFLCFITTDYYQSYWTNQEIGFALAKEVPIYLYSHDGTDPEGFKMDIQAIKQGEKVLIKCVKDSFSDHPSLKEGLIKNFIEARDGTFQGAKDAFFEILGLTFSNAEIENIVTAIEGPARYVNQLGILLIDPILQEHKVKNYSYYRELLESKILSQHSNKIYSVAKDEAKGRFYIRSSSKVDNKTSPEGA